MSKRPQKVKAAIMVEQNQPLIIDSIKLPEELFTGQVLVKVHVSGICGSQLGEIAGTKGIDKYLPHLMGHEGCATVLETGPGVRSVNVGDLVVLHWRKGEGIQADTPKYEWRESPLNAGWVTTFNTHAIISENRCTKIPKTTNHDLAALFGCAITTGFGVVENNAKIKMGESVVVFGAGGIGLNIIQASSLLSAWPIIAVDLHDNRLKLAKSIGATHIINSNKSNAKDKIKQILMNQNLDVFIDNTGSPKVIEMGYELLDKNGRIVLVGVPKHNSNINIHTLPLHFGKTITGSHGGESQPDIDIPRYNNVFNQKIASVSKTITERYSLDNINDAIESMRNGKSSGRIIVDM